MSILNWVKRQFGEKQVGGYIPTDEEKKAYWEKHHQEIREQMLADFYGFLDLKSLFGEDLSEDWSKYAIWISLGVSIITLILVIKK